MLTKRRVPRSEEEYDLITLGNDLDITLVTDDQINGKILIRCFKKKSASLRQKFQTLKIKVSNRQTVQHAVSLIDRQTDW